MNEIIEIPIALWTLIKVIRTRVRMDWDIVIAVTGEEGVGKSTLNIIIGIGCDENFNFEDNIIYLPSIKKVKEKAIKLKPYSVIDLDEAIKILYKNEWFTRLQIFLRKLFKIFRKENKIWLLAMPGFTDFTTSFRNTRIKVWIHIIDRGKAIVFIKDWSPASKDPFWLDLMQKHIDKSFKYKKILDITTDEKIESLRKLRTYAFDFTFPELPKSIQKKYEELVSKHKYEGLDQELEEIIQTGKRERHLKGVLSNALKLITEEYTQRNLAEKIGCSQSFISTLLKKKEEEA